MIEKYFIVKVVDIVIELWCIKKGVMYKVCKFGLFVEYCDNLGVFKKG